MTHSDKEMRVEERTVLGDIFGEQLLVDAEESERAGWAGRVRLSDADGNALELRWRTPLEYPSSDPPVVWVQNAVGSCRSVDTAALDKELCEIFTPGEPTLFQWIEHVREKVNQSIQQAEELASSMEGAVELSGWEDEQDDASYEEPATYGSSFFAQFQKDKLQQAHTSVTQQVVIISGAPLTVRKSTFQAHLCRVHCMEDVWRFLACLKSNSKIARATHNILAFVIEKDGQWIRDNDDDGETAAGSRLAHLLSILKVKNVAVVVSRWFGGILLGAERFKVINSVARKHLEENGEIPS